MLEALAIGALIAGTGMQAFGQYQEGKMTKELYQRNRTISLRYARAIREIRAWEIGQFLKEAAQIVPKQRTIAAVAGLEESGTVLSVMNTTRQKIREQAKIMEAERDMEISRIKSGAAMSEYQGELAYKSAKVGAFSTLLAGGGQLGMYGYKQGWKIGV